MTRNPKPDELPGPMDELTGPTRPLVLDHYLGREAIIERIAAEAGIEADVDPSTGTLTHDELAHLTAAIVDDEGRSAWILTRETEKNDLIARLGDAYGFRTRDQQTDLIKSNLIHILLSLATDTPPEQFEVPSDPDETDPNPNVPVLGEA